MSNTEKPYVCGCSPLVHCQIRQKEMRIGRDRKLRCRESPRLLWVGGIGSLEEFALRWNGNTGYLRIDTDEKAREQPVGWQPKTPLALISNEFMHTLAVSGDGTTILMSIAHWFTAGIV